jgi:hypothetical protein
MNCLEDLAGAGYRLIPLRAGADSKKPRDEKYAEKNYTLAELTGNVGLIIDQEHVDVDLDWPETQRLSGLLPRTRLMFGRGEPFRVTHFVYRAKLDKPIDFKLPKVSGHTLEGEHAHVVLQLRTSAGGEAYHVMVPPSVHPNGDKLDWFYRARGDENEGILPSEADAEALIRQAGLIAALAFFERFYPGAGMRDDFALALTGALIRGGWSDDQVQWFVGKLASMAGDEEAEMRASKAPRTRARLDAGKSVRGLSSIPALLSVPPEWVREVACWLGIRKSHGDGAAVFNVGIIRDTAQQAWTVLEDYMIGGDPAVYSYGDAIGRVDKGRVEILARQQLRHELNRAAKWLVPSGDEARPWKPSNAPLEVVDDMLAARADNLSLTPIVSVATTPIFTKEGKLVSRRGYDWDAQCFVIPSVEVDVPDEPTSEQVREAVTALLEPLADFPFADQSDRANVLAMMLQPYIRDLLDTTPLYFINKPTPGTGASLLVYAATYAARGSAPPTTKPPSREEEMEKLLTSMLMEGADLFYLDNADYLASTAMAAAMTADRHKGRILGISRTIEVPVRCMWIATGNNPDTTQEMYRRFVDIRLDAQMEFPEDRPPDQFSIPDLKVWVRENRSRLVSAALTIIQAWVRAGMPDGSKSKASFEQWARVMSGIIENAGVEGFLSTPVTRRPMDQKTEEMRGVLAQWWMLSRGKRPKGAEHLADLNAVDWTRPVKASDLWAMIQCTGLDFETLHKDPARAVGDKLRQFKERTFELETGSGGRLRIVLKGREQQNSMRWWLDAERVEDVQVAEVRVAPF